MAKPRVGKRSDSKDERESEKQRAKRNRDKFRQLIMDLNNCISNDSLSTNKCLSTAISILSLEKVHNSHRNTIMADPSDAESATSSQSPAPTSPAPMSPALMSPAPMRELIHLLSARDCFGLGFNESGIILYTSPNFKTTVGYKDSVLGENLDKVVLRSQDILNKTFNENTLHFMCMVHIVKMAGKDLAPFHFQGKTLPCQGGGRMFLGYGEKKSTIISDPMHYCNVNEVLINVDLSFVSKRNVYIDSLLGYGSYQNCTTEHVVSEDLMGLYASSGARQSVAKDFQTDGYAQHVCRLTCADDTLLYVLAKVFLHVNQEGVPIMISYSFPFAFSTQSQQTIDEGMRFITNNEQWLALMPSFFRPHTVGPDKHPAAGPDKHPAAGPSKYPAADPSKHPAAGPSKQPKINTGQTVPTVEEINPSENFTIEQKTSNPSEHVTEDSEHTAPSLQEVLDFL